MKILKVAETEIKPTQEMIEWFEKRTKNHISLVQKYAKKIVEKFPELKELNTIVKKHDASKLEEPERTPYIFVSWKYRCKDLGKAFDFPDNVLDKMNEATEIFERGNKYCYCKTLTPLKSKSQCHWFWPFDGGATEFYEILTNLNECEDGLYTVTTCDEFTDWETGYLEDYRYKLVPYKESKTNG